MKPASSNVGVSVRKLVDGQPELLAIVAHEVKTPLTGIAGLLRLIESEPNREKRYEYMQAAMKSAELAGNMLKDLLDDAQVKAGKLSINETPFNPEDVIVDAEKFWRPQIEAKGIIFDVFTTASRGRMIGDAHRIRQMIDNLLSNALKHTEAGTIRLSSSFLADGSWQLEIVDTGCGISPENYAKVFRPFQQFDTDAARKSLGTGLGLSIVRQLAEAMGGHAGFRRGLQHGAALWLTVPLPCMQDTATSLPTDLTEQCELAGAKGNILIVEDDPVNQLITRIVVERLGYKTTVVSDSEQALKAAVPGAFCAILMDIELPTQSGSETANMIRSKLGEALTPPIIGVTAHCITAPNKWHDDQCMVALIEKPVSSQKLSELLARDP